MLPVLSLLSYVRSEEGGRILLEEAVAVVGWAGREGS